MVPTRHGTSVDRSNIETRFRDPRAKATKRMHAYVVPLRELGRADIELVGGKNSSLGEMLRALRGLASRSRTAMRPPCTHIADFLGQDGLDRRIEHALHALDVGRFVAPWRARAPRSGKRSWPRRCLLACARKCVAAWHALDAGRGISVAVRSSATAEDLPDASFAGQQATFLNVRGERDLLAALHEVFASLFNDRAIAYRVHQGFEHSLVGLSVGVQHMVRSDLGASGVMFTLDTDSGFRDVVFITSSYGLGETVVQGAVNPDEFYVYKPASQPGDARSCGAISARKPSRWCMPTAAPPSASRPSTYRPSARRVSRSTDHEIEELARQAVTIERHYGCPMDIEWAKDGDHGPAVNRAGAPGNRPQPRRRSLQRFALKSRSRVLAEGRSIGQKIAAGRARLVAGAAGDGACADAATC